MRQVLGESETDMSTKGYKRISFIVPAAIVQPLLELIAEEASSLQMETVADPYGEPVAVPKKRRRRGRQKLTRIHTTVMRQFRTGATFTMDDARAWLTGAGLAPTSASPSLSTLIQHGHVLKLETGKFKFVKPLVNPNPRLAVVSR